MQPLVATASHSCIPRPDAAANAYSRISSSVNIRFVDVFSSLEQPAKMVLYNLASNPFDPPTPLQELHSAMDERVMALRPKLQPPEVRLSFLFTPDQHFVNENDFS